MLLKVGSKGEDVKKLQSFLGLGADGSFGPGTEKAVKGWQSANGLTPDGLVGDGTWAKMFPAGAASPPSRQTCSIWKTGSHVDSPNGARHSPPCFCPT
jgi:peptidoglycan hydrolase-like protein with peptidoglycan-binding domain